MKHQILRLLQPVRDTVNALRLPNIAREVRRRKLTYLSDAKFVSLSALIRQIRRERIPGDFVEYGIALGGSAVYLASEASGRRFRGYDVFGMIPPPGEHDDAKSKQRYEVIRAGQSKGISDDPYYGYEVNLYDKVCGMFAAFGIPVDDTKVILSKGLFQDTVKFASDDRIALAHLDCDWYDPVRLCLERTADVLQPGGYLILDDYNDYGGCRQAADEFLGSNPRFTLVRTQPHAVIRADRR